ncbi:DUF3566 domain-containing protein [Actinocrispum wychmicini]|uniref:Transmembrane protein DUF3566 n=1 Tax=Actinocrispum wychmicini TaxID=1213861 RepID=A0A4R2JZ74_9PSEU|nr:DUF3566 domain-containing protein [Actinocrispum wychmicini]TCO64657.1 transmembrane protein DUF3566 [Actinocrispum wychmicini]
MTPPETQDGRGTDKTQEVAVDRTVTVSTVNRSTSTEQPQQQANGQGEATEKAAQSVAVEDEAAAPPPWQRVTSDAKYAADPEPEPVQPPVVEERTRPRLVDEETVSVPRPVVTGTAAPRALGEYPPVGLHQTGPQPPIGQPARTTVNLGGQAPPIPGLAGAPRGSAPPSALRRPGRGPRRANLQIKRFDPWSVLKLSLVLGVALFFVWMVAVGVLYAVLDGMGVWDKINGIGNDLFAANSGGTGQPLVSAGRVFGVAAIIGAVNIVLFSALATVGAFVYNVSADLAGGLEVTLAERE